MSSGYAKRLYSENFGSSLHSPRNPSTTGQRFSNPQTGQRTSSSGGASRMSPNKQSTLPWLVCEQCGYRNRYKSQMRIHKYTHTGEKPFACSFCSFQTAQSNNLYKHIRRHHPERADTVMQGGSSFDAVRPGRPSFDSVRQGRPSFEGVRQSSSPHDHWESPATSSYTHL